MLRKGVLLIIGCFSCLMLLFSAGSAYAVATSFSEAIIYWDTFGYSFVGASGADITDEIYWWWQDSWSAAEAWSDFGYDDVWEDGWVDTSAVASVPYAEGNGWTTDDEVGEDVWAQADGINTEAGAWASAERYGEFEALQDGTLTVWVDYFLSQDLSTDYPGEYAWGYAYADAGLYNDDSGEEVYDYDELEAGVGDGEIWNDSASGTFTGSLWFDEGDQGEFWAYVHNGAYAYSEYVVPEPATLSLLSLGMLGFGFLRRKRN